MGDEIGIQVGHIRVLMHDAQVNAQIPHDPFRLFVHLGQNLASLILHRFGLLDQFVRLGLEHIELLRRVFGIFQ